MTEQGFEVDFYTDPIQQMINAMNNGMNEEEKQAFTIHPAPKCVVQIKTARQVWQQAKSSSTTDNHDLVIAYANVSNFNENNKGLNGQYLKVVRITLGM